MSQRETVAEYKYQPPRSIKNLISRFESISHAENENIPKNERSPLRQSSKDIKKIFTTFQKDIAENELHHDIQSKQKELDRNVRVKTLVYNFQNRDAEKDNHQLDQKKALPPRQSSLTKLTVAKYESKSTATTYSNITKQSSVSVAPVSLSNISIDSKSGLFDMKSVNATPPIIITKTKQDICETLSSAKNSYKIMSSTTKYDSDDESSDGYESSPAGSPRSRTYQICGKSPTYEIRIKPPPSKGAIKKTSTSPNKSVQFSTGHEEAETYNRYVYFRGDEQSDYVASSNAFELEKQAEKMERIDVEIHKTPDQKLGLSVYGLTLNHQNTNGIMAIYVKSIVPGSLCDECQKMEIDDLIVEINDIPLIGVEVPAVQDAIKKGGETVRFVLARKREDDESETLEFNSS